MTCQPVVGRRSRRPAVPILVGIFALMVAAGGCAGVSRLPQEEDLHPRLTPTSYIEEGKLLVLAVDANAATHREKSAFVPVAVVVANKTMQRLALNRESFTLMDDAGKRYPLASISESRSNGGQMNGDYRYAENFFEVNAMSFSAWRYQTGSFFPVQAMERETSAHRVLREKIEMNERMYMSDILYFPHPDGVMIGRKFELWMTSPDLTEPVFVKFRIGKAKPK
jgi:hypothetical protein